MTRDTQRAKVYAAEEFVHTLFDRTAEHGDPVANFFSTQLTLPPEARFASVRAVQRNVDEVPSQPAVRGRWPVAARLWVRSRKGATAAHYEREGNGAFRLSQRLSHTSRIIVGDLSRDESIPPL